MKHAGWVKGWSLSSTALVVVAYIAVVLLTLSTDMPLRFTKSISYDAKIKFIKQKLDQRQYDTYVLGSSMALNNIDSAVVENTAGAAVLNLASWGMGTSESLQLLQFLDLSGIRRVIYASQYFDYVGEVDKVLYPDELTRYFEGLFPYKAYFFNIARLPQNLWDTLDLERRYTDNRSQNLLFDANGDVNFDKHRFRIDPKRWSKIPGVPTVPLGDEYFKHLVAMHEFLRAQNIELVVVTNPFRGHLLQQQSAEFQEFFAEHIAYLQKLAGERGFVYVNAHDQLRLADDFFVDPTHLNSIGAEKVTRLVVERMEQNPKSTLVDL